MERLLAEVDGAPGVLVYLKATADGKLIVDSSAVAGSTADRELVVSTYRCKTAFSGASVGDTITATQVIDVSGATPSTVSTVWRNQTTAADLSSAPSAANLELTGSTALTAAQLTAAGLATSALQTAGNSSLTSIDGKTPALVTGRVPVDGSGVTQPVSAASLPLPTGAATEVTLSAANAWLSGIFSKLPALVSGRSPVVSSVPNVSSGTILGLTTNATGTTYTAFSSQACTALDIVNNTGTTVEYRRGGAGTAMQIPTGAARMVIGITNANQVDVRRTDTSNTTVAIQAEAFVL